MTTLRLLADDLTGALDTAAQFAGALGPVTVRFREAGWRATEPRLAFSSDTRDRPTVAAEAALAPLAGFFAGTDIAFKKIDSLLRGNTVAEVARVFRDGGFRSCVLAPAFPAQHRITRDGAQLVRSLDGTLHDVRPGFAEALARAGLPLRLAPRPEQVRGSGVILCDAASDAHLMEIVAHAVALEPPLLWCGSAGLARALASAPVPRTVVPPKPLLMVIGSNHPVTQAQVAMLREQRLEAVLALRSGDDAAARVHAAFERSDIVVVTFDLEANLSPEEAGSRIEGILTAHLCRTRRPAGLFVSGGETLETVASAVGATGFTVGGEVAPGVPCSLLCGGAWDGVRIASKSGAFGDASLLARLVASAGEPLGAAP